MLERLSNEPENKVTKETFMLSVLRQADKVELRKRQEEVRHNIDAWCLQFEGLLPLIGLVSLSQLEQVIARFHGISITSDVV
jgi:aryl-alcohol dehydrogenase-like predicted oxidoreductase